MQQTTSSPAGREYPVARCLVVHDSSLSPVRVEYHPERCGQHARLLLREGPGPNNGKIGVFCTLGQKTSTFLARYSRNVPSDSVFSVRSVQNTPISPKWAVQEYISVKSCRKAVLWLRWGTFGEDFATCPLSLGDCSLGQAVSGFVGHVSAFRSGFACRIESRDCSRIGPRDSSRIGPEDRLSHSARNRSCHRSPGEGRPLHTGGNATCSQPRWPLRYNRSRKHA